MMTEKWATGKPWSECRNEGCPLYRITGETPSRLYAELVSGSGYLHGQSKKFIHRYNAVFLVSAEAIVPYRKAWNERKNSYDAATAVAHSMKTAALEAFDVAVADLVIDD